MKPKQAEYTLKRPEMRMADLTILDAVFIFGHET
ncbi:MAG: hypothetical protein H6Q28_759, partial [Bacteroidetes bacterium]|nr:hypothetical protein [Bacteroidota bacterium]